MKRGCGKIIEYITGQHIVMHTEVCGKISQYGDYNGILILCNKCRKGQLNEGEKK